MSSRFVVSLLAAVIVVLAARALWAGLPLAKFAKRVTVADTALLVVGIAVLAFHCGAMFFPRLVDPLPLTGAAASDIRALGAASIVWYVVPAILLLIALRRQHVTGQAAVALTLTVVGVTMYNGGSLQVHLAAIYFSVMTLAGVSAALLLPPWAPQDQRLNGHSSRAGT